MSNVSIKIRVPATHRPQPADGGAPPRIGRRPSQLPAGATAPSLNVGDLERRTLRHFQLGPAAFVAAAVVAASFALPAYWSLLLALGMVWALAALGLVILTGYVGQISLAQAALLGLGAFLTATLAGNHGWPLPLAAVAAVAGAAVAGTVIGIPALRIRGLTLAIVTWGFALFADRFVFRIRWLTGGQSGRDLAPPTYGPVDLADARVVLFTLAAVIVAVAVVTRNLLAGRTGQSWVALRDSEQGAQALGVDVARQKLTGFAIASAIAGLAGAFHALLVPYLSVNDYNQYVSVMVLAIAVIGGIDSLLGPLVGGLIYAAGPQVLKDLGVTLTGSRFDLIIGAVLVLIVVGSPKGVAGIIRSLSGSEGNR
ncbi:MAG: branched-chain amino acid ABC transporter permease [Actinomycetota bacterium]